MTIIRVQHIGIAVRDFQGTLDKFEKVYGLSSRDFRDDQGKGYQHDSRILLGNDCWIHVVHNWDPNSRVYQFMEKHGEGLEHIALETDDIEADVKRIRDMGIPIFQDKIFDANDGYEAFVYPDDAIGFTIELIQPHDTSWVYPDDVGDEPISNKMGLVRLHHIGVGVDDLQVACDHFEKLFDMPARDFRDDQGQGMQLDARVLLGNECWLHIVQNWNSESRVNKFFQERGPELEHLALQTTTIEEDVQYLKDNAIPVFQDKIFDANDGYEAFVYPDDGVTFTIELIQPHEHSWAYPED